LCNLINKPHIKILIVIGEIHQFRLYFSHGGSSPHSLTVWDVFHVLLGRTFVFALRINPPPKKKTL